MERFRQQAIRSDPNFRSANGRGRTANRTGERRDEGPEAGTPEKEARKLHLTTDTSKSKQIEILRKQEGLCALFAHLGQRQCATPPLAFYKPNSHDTA